jgi:cytochrome c biogenesis protein CcmG, thiol:disulfide interchange protein DsbE
MSVRWQWLIVLVVVAVLAFGAWTAVRIYGHEIFPVDVGTRAPDFQAHELFSKRERTMEDYRGKVLLLNVWATWCAPCRVEMPSIEALYRDYKQHGLQVLAVSVDEAGDDRIDAFRKELGLTFDIVHDSTSGIQSAYQIPGYPATFVIAKDGTIRKKWVGEANWNSSYNRALVASLLELPTR